MLGTTEKPLDGKVALVTGASRRIGREIALGLASAGADVVVHARQARDEVDAVAAEVRALGRRAHMVMATSRMRRQWLICSIRPVPRLGALTFWSTTPQSGGKNPFWK